MRGTPKGFERLRQNGCSLPSWVAKALDGGTESPLRLRRCPPFRKGGCCYASSGSLAKGSWHGEAVTEGFRTPVVPLIRHGCAMPPSPLRGEGFGLYFRRCSNVNGVPLIRHGLRRATFPQGKAFLTALAPPLGADSPYQGEMSRRDKRDRDPGTASAVTERAAT